VLRRYQERNEEMDPVALVRMTSREDGTALEFKCRNIFDFGYVVNPDYEVMPGKKGGLSDVDRETGVWFWMWYESGEGWNRVREMTAFERDCMEYLGEFPPIADGIRM
jgi:hypothetical protein